MAYRVEVRNRPDVKDSRGESITREINSFLNVQVSSVGTQSVYLIDAALTKEELNKIKDQLFLDPVIEEAVIGKFSDLKCDWIAEVSFKPGVTDNVGKTSHSAVEDVIKRKLKPGENVYTSTQFLFSGESLAESDIKTIASKLLYNPLIQSIRINSLEEWNKADEYTSVPKIQGEQKVRINYYDLSLSDDRLMQFSQKQMLALSIEELHSVTDYFKNPEVQEKRKKLGLDPEKPTDVEMECIAQTWSEHCKHKIFNALIDYSDNGFKIQINSLFDTYIKKATKEISKDVSWLVSVFHDNAGVVRFNDKYNIVYKVETHNSPSALEPYGGAITGIVGVNRDPLGTGKGAELLINVWGYCFGSPFYKGDVPTELLHPRTIREGVHRGVIDGGNQSGIPYGRGWEFFDPRYMGKPLVFCGTVGTLPVTLHGKSSHLKEAYPGDFIVMAGGRIGKDGIHGATFSSEELHEESPVQAVQIGDPITQKKMYDFLIEARDLNLYNNITDNGAGGLSSSIGEMALSSNGAKFDLSKAPLKYQGLEPWEILISEAQERMTLAVPPEKIESFKALAERRDVEITVLGEFDNSGYLNVTYGEKTILYIDLDFLHNGDPQMKLKAKWEEPHFPEPLFEEPENYETVLNDILARLNVCSNETKARQYDHEVKGLSVIKPFTGLDADVPADATVFMIENGSIEGIVLAEGKNPHFGDIDTYHMVASAVDEAVRRVVASGGKLGTISGLDNFCWPDPVQSAKTPDGEYKLAQLVRANMALYDYTKAYKVPCISGKDSMKNDCIIGGKKISIPPTLLFSVIGKINDISKATTLDVKKAGDLVYILGSTFDETGASEYYYYMGEKMENNPYIGKKVPKVDASIALDIYRKLEAAIENETVNSVHTPTLGGLGIAFAKTAFAGGMGLNIDLNKCPADNIERNDVLLFSESNSRFIVTVPAEKKEEFEKIVNGISFANVGVVTQSKQLKVTGIDGSQIIDIDINDLKNKWQNTLRD